MITWEEETFQVDEEMAMLQAQLLLFVDTKCSDARDIMEGPQELSLLDWKYSFSLV